MKRRFAALAVILVLAVGHSAPAFSATRDSASQRESFLTLVVKAVKKVFHLSASEDLTPPKP